MAAGYTPRSDDELRKLAASQVDADINGQVSPYESQLNSVYGRESGALGDVSNMFGSLQPYVTGAAANVAHSYDLAQQGEQGVFEQAFAKLNALKAGRAAEAQSLAQEIGGPVAMNEFTQSTDNASQELTESQATSLLHGLGLAQAGVQEANSFAGKVFPALRTETETKTRNYYEDQAKQLKDQITTIKSGRQGAVDTRYNDLLDKERQYRLDQTNLKLQQTTEAHNWEATKAGIAQENRRIKDAESQFTTTSGQTDRQMTDQERQFNRTYGQNQQQMDNQWQTHQDDMANQRANSAVGVLDAITSPGKATTVTQTTQQPVAPPADPKHPPAGYYAQPKKGGGVQWYRTQTTKQPVTTGSPVTDPNRAYNYLLSTVPGLSHDRARQMVAAKYGLPPTWQPKGKAPKGKPKPKPKNPGRGHPGANG